MFARRMREIELSAAAREELGAEGLERCVDFGRRLARLEVAAEFSQDEVLAAKQLQLSRLAGAEALQARDRRVLNGLRSSVGRCPDGALERPRKVEGVGLANSLACFAQQCFERRLFGARLEHENESGFGTKAVRERERRAAAE